MKKIIASKTLKKVNVLLANFDEEAGKLASQLLSGEVEPKDAKSKIDTLSDEITSVYKGIKSTVTASKKSFTASVSDSQLDSTIAKLAIVATKIDLIDAIAVDMMGEEEPEDVSTEEVLKDLGVNEEEAEPGEEGEEEGEEEEAEEETEEESEEEETEEESEESEGEEESEEEESEEEEVEEEEEDFMPQTASKKYTAKRVVKVVSSKQNPVESIFNFIK